MPRVIFKKGSPGSIIPVGYQIHGARNPFPAKSPEHAEWQKTHQAITEWYNENIEAGRLAGSAPSPEESYRDALSKRGEHFDTTREFSSKLRNGQKLILEQITPTGAVFTKPEGDVKYFFDQYKIGMAESTAKTMEQLAKTLERSVKGSMRAGDYRPYRSKRIVSKKLVELGSGRAKNKRFAPLKETLGSKTRKALMLGGLSPEAAREKWRIAYSKEAIGTARAGTLYHTGTVKNKAGEKIGTRFSLLEKDMIGAIHWSSKPGLPPAPDTGELKKSIRSEIVLSGHVYHLRLIADTPYARVMELGSAAKSIAPRPYLRTAIDRMKYQKEFSRLMRINWEEQIRGTSMSHNVWQERQAKVVK